MRKWQLLMFVVLGPALGPALLGIERPSLSSNQPTKQLNAFISMVYAQLTLAATQHPLHPTHTRTQVAPKLFARLK